MEKQLSSIKPTEQEAVEDIVKQQEELFIELIGREPTFEEISNQAFLVTKQDGNEIFTWNGKNLVELTPFECYDVSDKHRQQVRCVKGYKILNES